MTDSPAERERKNGAERAVYFLSLRLKLGSGIYWTIGASIATLAFLRVAGIENWYEREQFYEECFEKWSNVTIAAYLVAYVAGGICGVLISKIEALKAGGLQGTDTSEREKRLTFFLQVSSAILTAAATMGLLSFPGSFWRAIGSRLAMALVVLGAISLAVYSVRYRRPSHLLLTLTCLCALSVLPASWLVPVSFKPWPYVVLAGLLFVPAAHKCEEYTYRAAGACVYISIATLLIPFLVVGAIYAISGYEVLEWWEQEELQSQFGFALLAWLFVNGLLSEVYGAGAGTKTEDAAKDRPPDGAQDA